MFRRIARLALVFVLALPMAAWAADADRPAPPIDLVAIRAALVGTWQSLDDTRLSRQFAADGSAIERYEGDASATAQGHWTIFSGNAPPKYISGQTFQPKAVYLELDQNGDRLLFGLVGLTKSDLKMVYLERGNLLSFERLQ